MPPPAATPRKPKPKPPPRFAPGQTVRTKRTVPVPNAGPRGRKWLYLLPGTPWLVVEVDATGKGRPVYTIRCSRWVVRRREWQLRY